MALLGCQARRCLGNPGFDFDSRWRGRQEGKAKQVIIYRLDGYTCGYGW